MGTAFLAEVPDLVKGYDWSVELVFDEPTFAAGDVLRAEIRRLPTDESRLGELTTAAGTLAVLDAQTLAVTIPGAMSADWLATRIRLDFAHVNQSPAELLAVTLDVPAVLPITRSSSPWP